MIVKNIVVGLQNGLEARNLANLVQIASSFSGCEVNIEYKGRRVNAKSIMGMLSLGIAKGEEVSLCVDGKDEKSAIDQMERYLICG